MPRQYHRRMSASSAIKHRRRGAGEIDACVPLQMPLIAVAKEVRIACNETRRPSKISSWHLAQKNDDEAPPRCAFSLGETSQYSSQLAGGDEVCIIRRYLFVW